MIKYYLVSFAKPSDNCTKYKKYFIEAIEYARRNLLTRYNIILSWFSAPFWFYVVVDLPSDAAFSNPGSRLRGISRYLLEHHEDIFEKYKVGTRLLWFTEVPNISLPLSEEVTNNDTEN